MIYYMFAYVFLEITLNSEFYKVKHDLSSKYQICCSETGKDIEANNMAKTELKLARKCNTILDKIYVQSHWLPQYYILHFYVIQILF